MSKSKNSEEITVLIERVASGDSKAMDLLAKDVYPVLKRIAKGQLKKDPNKLTISPTVLVHEVFIEYFLKGDVRHAKNRVHFYAMIAKAMRWYLIEQARAKGAQKRGQRVIHLTLNESLDGVDNPLIDILTLDTLLNELQARNERLYDIVQMKCFAGLSSEEIGDALDISVATVKREWKIAQAWLQKRLDPNKKAA